MLPSDDPVKLTILLNPAGPIMSFYFPIPIPGWMYGIGYLRHFRVVFDYPHRRVLLARTRETDAKEAFDRSGVFAVANGSALHDRGDERKRGEERRDRLRMIAGHGEREVIDHLDETPHRTGDLPVFKPLRDELEQEAHAVSARRAETRGGRN